jgi:hypothetical protein
MVPEQTPAAVAETVQKAVTTASVISHVRNNRIEYLLGLGLLHLLGVSDRLLAQMNGVCF